MEAKEILAKYKGQIIKSAEPVKRAVEALERPIESPGGDVVWDDNISIIKVCEVFDVDEKELTERAKGKLVFIVNELKRLGHDKPENHVIRLLNKIGSPPHGQDSISHLANYLKLRASSDGIGGEKLGQK